MPNSCGGSDVNNISGNDGGGSNDGSDNSSALNARGGSDNGSGNQVCVVMLTVWTGTICGCAVLLVVLSSKGVLVIHLEDIVKYTVECRN